MQMDVTPLTSFKYALLYFIIKYVKHVKYCNVVVIVCLLCSVYGLRIYISYSIAIFLYDRCIAQIFLIENKIK